jgi:hypothetical protein
LLAFVRDQFAHGIHFWDHELWCPCHHVLLLLLNGHPSKTQSIQGSVHYSRTDFPNDRGRYRHSLVRVLSIL